MIDENDDTLKMGSFCYLGSKRLDSFINDKLIKNSINEKGLTTPSSIGVVKVYINSKSIISEVKKDKKWLLFIFLSDDKSRELIVKARAEQENTSPSFNIDCNAEAVYLQKYKQVTVLLYSTKVSEAEHMSVMIRFSILS